MLQKFSFSLFRWEMCELEMSPLLHKIIKSRIGVTHWSPRLVLLMKCKGIFHSIALFLNFLILDKTSICLSPIVWTLNNYNNVSELLSKLEQKAVYISVSIFEIPKELLFREVDKNREYLINWNQRYFFKSRILPRACYVLKLELHAHLLDVSELELPLLQVIS